MGPAVASPGRLAALSPPLCGHLEASWLSIMCGLNPGRLGAMTRAAPVDRLSRTENSVTANTAPPSAVSPRTSGVPLTVKQSHPRSSERRGLTHKPGASDLRLGGEEASACERRVSWPCLRVCRAIGLGREWELSALLLLHSLCAREQWVPDSLLDRPPKAGFPFGWFGGTWKHVFSAGPPCGGSQSASRIALHVRGSGQKLPSVFAALSGFPSSDVYRIAFSSNRECHVVDICIPACSRPASGSGQSGVFPEQN